MKLFEKAGRANTAETVEIAAKKAAELGCDMVISTNEGESALALYEAAKKLGFKGKIVAVTHVSNFQRDGKNELAPEMRKKLTDMRIAVVTTAHALSSAERSFSTRFRGVYPVEIMAYTLRTFGQGTKVCFECAVMALDNDAIEFGKPVVSVGGTGRGVDTALVLTPSYSASILDTKVHEMLCKPSLAGD